MYSSPPPAGLCLPCRVRAVISPDHYLIDLAGGCEIELFVLGVHAVDRQREDVRAAIIEPLVEDDPQAAIIHSVRDQIHAWLSAADVVTAWIPQPNFDRGWVQNIRPGSRHAGMLYLDQAWIIDSLRDIWPVERLLGVAFAEGN